MTRAPVNQHNLAAAYFTLFNTFGDSAYDRRRLPMTDI